MAVDVIMRVSLSSKKKGDLAAPQEYRVLRVLVPRPQTGSELLAKYAETWNEELSPGSLYSHLHRFRQDDLVSSKLVTRKVSGIRGKDRVSQVRLFEATGAGRRALAYSHNYYCDLVNGGKASSGLRPSLA